jgi:alkanesulfonate monooxygenase SsuD/methylene tetrahydromethanopterin reductase-like flavin-dependent oxidoreductase (luciferase family)
MSEKIGLVAFWKGYDRKLYLRAAQLADELGYDSFWLPEAWSYEVTTLLTEMVLATSGFASAPASSTSSRARPGSSP